MTGLAFADSCDVLMTSPLSDPELHARLVADTHRHADQRTEQDLDFIPDFNLAGLPTQAERPLHVYALHGRDLPPDLRQAYSVHREKTFREAKEGTGKPSDWEPIIDDNYRQIIAAKVKGDQKPMITGGYRLAPVWEVWQTGLYTLRQFDYSALLTETFRTQMVEVSRSWVVPGVQGGFSLKLMLAVIGKIILIEMPDVRHLGGTVSMSASLSDNSKLLVSRYYMRLHAHPQANLVRASQPPRLQSTLTENDLDRMMNYLEKLGSVEKRMKVLDEWVNLAEGNGYKKGVPQLFKIYGAGLGAQFLGFSEDSEFNTLDALIVVDVSALSAETLVDYTELAFNSKAEAMNAAQAYIARHQK